MAMDATVKQYEPTDTMFYRKNYQFFFYGLIGTVLVLLLAVGFVLYQLANRPIPEFYARMANGDSMRLQSFDSPNLLPETITRFASKAAVTAYTFNFVNFEEQIAQARPYFTEAGWADFRSSISGLANTIVERQLFISGVVVGQPVISNEGNLPGIGYTWRIQVPFLVTFKSSNDSTQRRYMVIVTMVKVPTSQNPQGIGIDQFVTK